MRAEAVERAEQQSIREFASKLKEL
jgi:hypothetical protein